MARELGLRERKKLELRGQLADVAAALFAERGYDAVSISDVAAAANVSYQTVYNYFPAKQDLALDRADEIRAMYDHAVRERPEGTSPAEALRPLVLEDIDRYRRSDLKLDRGEHPALCVDSPTFRGFALLARERDAHTVAAAISETNPSIHPLVGHAHAAALVSVVQAMTDRVGVKVLAGEVSDAAADDMARDADAAFDALDQQFLAMESPAYRRTRLSHNGLHEAGH
jgi:AcrR family transcriptional regulator